MDFDKTKMFIYVEDNGDNTCSLMFNAPQINVCEESMMPCSLGEMLGSLLRHVDLFQEVLPQPIIIPNSPEE